MTDLAWHNERRKISDLIPHPQNPRQLTETQVEGLKHSLEKFNLVEIPAIDTDNTILAGHQRLKIMHMIGRGDEEVDVRVPNRKLTDKERDGYVITSNKQTGEWDWNILANWDQQLLMDSGFSKLELSRGFDLNVKPEETEDDAPPLEGGGTDNPARRYLVARPAPVTLWGRYQARRHGQTHGRQKSADGFY